MPRYTAFLRAINVGGHIVKMTELKRIFETLGLSNVETFIASGNVIFETRVTNTTSLEAKIEKALEKRLGYEVATFLRSDEELKAIAEHEAFAAAEIATASAHCVIFLSAAPDADGRKRIEALSSDADAFHVNGRELYWLSRLKQSESKFSNALLERTLKQRSTARGVNTVRKLAAKYPPKPAR
jgi:uncharacterized protein (DUF1697 family)